MKSKKVFSLLMAAAFSCTLLTGCGGQANSAVDVGSASDPAAPQSDTVQSSTTGLTTITIANEADPGSLAPWGPRGVRNYFVNQVYQQLGKWDADKVFVPVLATGYDSEGDGLYIVHLHDNIHDSAGNHITASDVKFSYEKFIEEGSNASYVSSLGSIEIQDDYTLAFQMENERAGAFETMITEVRIVSEAAYNESPDGMANTPVGTAPYKMTEFVPGSHATFVKNEDYWNKDAAEPSIFDKQNVDQIIVSVITDASTLAIAMENGEIDFTQNMGAADMGNFVDAEGSPLEGYGANYSYHSVCNHLVFNASDASPCRDINLRRAISYAIDAAAIAQSCWNFRGHEAALLINPLHFDYDADHAAYFSYDMQKAQEYLDASDYNGQTLRMLVDSNSVVRQAAVLVQAYLLQLNINVELLEYEDALYQSYRVGDGTVDGIAYDIEFSAPASNTYGWNLLFEFDANNYSNQLPRTYVADEQMQSLYQTAASAETAGVEAMDALMDYICEEMCYARPIYYYTKCALYNARIAEMATDNTGSIVPGACVVTN